MDDEIKGKMGEMEQEKFASFDANDNEVSMVVPSLKVTSNVSEEIISKNSRIEDFFCI